MQLTFLCPARNFYTRSDFGAPLGTSFALVFSYELHRNFSKYHQLRFPYCEIGVTVLTHTVQTYTMHAVRKTDRRRKQNSGILDRKLLRSILLVEGTRSSPEIECTMVSQSSGQEVASICNCLCICDSTTTVHWTVLHELACEWAHFLFLFIYL